HQRNGQWSFFHQIPVSEPESANMISGGAVNQDGLLHLFQKRTKIFECCSFEVVHIEGESVVHHVVCGYHVRFICQAFFIRQYIDHAFHTGSREFAEAFLCGLSGGHNLVSRMLQIWQRIGRGSQDEPRGKENDKNSNFLSHIPPHIHLECKSLTGTRLV